MQEGYSREGGEGARRGFVFRGIFIIFASERIMGMDKGRLDICAKAMAWAVVAMCVVGVWVWMFCTDDLTDDWWYRHEFCYGSYEDALVGFEDCNGAVIESWGQVWSSIKGHCLWWNNCRLANVLMFVSAMVPGWVVDLVHGLMWGLMGVMVLHFGLRGWRGRPLGAVLVLWSVWLALPWYDQMASGDYQMNYVWSTALVLLFLYALECRWSERGLRSRVAVWVLALAASLMHEGVSLPVSLGLLAVWLKGGRGKRVSVEVWLFWAGCVAVCCGPAVWNRLGGLSGGGDVSLWGWVYKFFVKEEFLSVVVGVLVVAAVWRGVRRVMSVVSRDLFWVVTGAVSVGIWMVLGGTARMGWIGFVALLVLLWRVTNELFFGSRRGGSVWGLCVAGWMGVLLMVWLCVIGDFQRRGCEELERVGRAMECGEQVVYADLEGADWLPWWVLDIPEYYQGVCPHVRGELHAWRRDGWDDSMPVLGSRYEGKGYEELPVVAGSAGLRGEYPVFYGDRKYGNSEGWAYFELEFSDVSGGAYLWNAHPFYRLGVEVSRLWGGTGRVRAAYVFRRRGVACEGGDTAWFYRAYRVPMSVRGCRLLRADSVGFL